uniref:Uncharacterized protein n=1 Tax=Crocodylus porosus TaxID=8502 RepID=A0A7M4EGH6_CROPO
VSAPGPDPAPRCPRPRAVPVLLLGLLHVGLFALLFSARLVQGLSSADPAAWEEAVAESETRLQTEAVGDEEECETRWNRTAISARAADTHDVKTENPGDFLAALEKDARERARRRKKNEGLANALKEKGNHAFSKGDYGTAVQRYTE